jgi:hypothetical protein
MFYMLVELCEDFLSYFTLASASFWFPHLLHCLIVTINLFMNCVGMKSSLLDEDPYVEISLSYNTLLCV